MLRTLTAVALVLATLGAPAFAAQAPPMIPPASKDPAAAPAGTYRMDPEHMSVIARVGHGSGTSLSTFRFTKATATLTWDPARVENSKIEVVLDPKSISHPVPGFADELDGEMFLNVAKYPDARFVSTSIRRTGPTTGEIVGNLTFMGQTKPMTIQAEMLGAAKNMRGVATIGFTGTARFKRSDFGFNFMVPMIGDEVDLIIDSEFNQG